MGGEWEREFEREKKLLRLWFNCGARAPDLEALAAAFVEAGGSLEGAVPARFLATLALELFKRRRLLGRDPSVLHLTEYADDPLRRRVWVREVNRAYNRIVAERAAVGETGEAAWVGAMNDAIKLTNTRLKP